MSILNETTEQSTEKTMPSTQESFAGLSGTPKTMFLFGLAAGAGGLAILVLVFASMAMMNGNGLSFANMKDATNPTNQAGAAEVNNPSAALPDTQTPPAAEVSPVTADDHIRGNANAKVTLIEYSDYECPYCAKHEPTMKQLLADYPNDVRVVYRHFPLSFHPQAENAAVASECAADQGKFWEMHDQLFAMNEAGALSVQGMKDAAAAIGLNTATFNTCLDNKETLDRVNEDYQGGVAAGVSGTPATFINGQIVEGAVPVSTFKQFVESFGASN